MNNFQESCLCKCPKMISWLPRDPNFFLMIHLSLCMNQGAFLPRFCSCLSLREEIALCADRVVTSCLANNKIQSEGSVWIICQWGRGTCLAFPKIKFFLLRCKFLSLLKRLQLGPPKYGTLIMDHKKTLLAKKLALMQNSYSLKCHFSPFSQPSEMHGPASGPAAPWS